MDNKQVDAQLEALRIVLDSQQKQMKELKQGMADLGIDYTKTKIDIDTLPQSERDAMLSFERELNGVIAQKTPEVKGAKRPKSRQLI